MAYIPESPDNKEEMMKRFMTLILFLMIVFTVIGCFATMSPEERKELYDLQKSVGDKPWVGSFESPEARNLSCISSFSSCGVWWP
jgi:hypothetical protein